MKKILKKGFTLIELLIVIGILGILIAAVLFTLNPAEAQRKGRDVQRLRDIGTLQTIMENLSQGNEIPTTFGRVASGGTAATAGKSDCKTNWIGIDVCNYASKVPVDPVNKATTMYSGVSANNVCTPTEVTTGNEAYYIIGFNQSKNVYEINVVQESKAGCSKVAGDGGNAPKYVEAGTDVNVLDADGALVITTP